MKSVDQLVADILQTEGGYNDHPEDRGGPTKYGISLKYLQGKYVGATKEDIENLTPEQASGFYKRDFFYTPHIDQLPALLQPQMFDMAVNHGASGAIKMLQASLLLTEDGRIGPQTCAAAQDAITKYGFPVVNNHIACLRKGFMQAIVTRDPSQAVFLKGWLARADSFVVV